MIAFIQGDYEMARRQGYPLYGARFCGNTSKKEVHDLDNEKVVCQIDEIVQAGHAIPFNTLYEAQMKGFDNCDWCIGGSTR
jgi:hypothetical protein